MFDAFTMQNRASSGPSVGCMICKCSQKSVYSAELPAAVLPMWCIAAGSCSAWVLPAHLSWFLGDISPPSRLAQFPLPQDQHGRSQKIISDIVCPLLIASSASGFIFQVLEWSGIPECLKEFSCSSKGYQALCSSSFDCTVTLSWLWHVLPTWDPLWVVWSVKDICGYRGDPLLYCTVSMSQECHKYHLCILHLKTPSSPGFLCKVSHCL